MDENRLAAARRSETPVVRASHVGSIAILLSGCLSVLMLAGCDSGSSPAGPSGPTALALVFSNERIQITRTTEVEAVYPSRNDGREVPECRWYVDGVEGGGSAGGTITQTNPATYAAPAAIPPGGTVEISAVSVDDAALAAAGTLAVVFTVRYVDGNAGVDVPSGGTWTAPLRTITFALGEVAAGDTVHVLPGVYGTAGGESGDYDIQPAVTLRGVSSDSCVLSGSGSQYRCVELGDGAVFEGFTLVNAGTDQIGILTERSGAIRDVAIHTPFEYAAMRADGVGGDNTVLIERCQLVNSTAPNTETAIELYGGTRCEIRECTVSGWQTGLHIEKDSSPLIEYCSITGNYYGMTLMSGGSGQDPEPDLGGGARDSAGGNAIRDNLAIGIANYSTSSVSALNNEWTTDPPTEGPPFPCDFYNPSGGSVIWER